MGLGNLWFLRSASRLACSVRSISTVMNRPSLVQKSYCPVRPVVSYTTAAIDHDDWISSEKAVIREIDSEFNAPVIHNENNVLESFLMCMWKAPSKGSLTPPDSFPFKIEEDIPSQTFTLTREYNGEHIKVVVTMSRPHHDDDNAPRNESTPHVEHINGEHIQTILTMNIPKHQDDNDESNDDDDDDDDAPSSESDDDEPNVLDIPIVVTLTKKSGRSLELTCSFRGYDKISINDIHVYLPGNSSEGPKVLQDMDDFVGMDHTSLKEAFNKYLKVRGFDESTILFIRSYISNKEREDYWLWLKSVKEFFEE